MNKKILVILIVATAVIVGAVYFLQQSGGGQNTELSIPSAPTNNPPTQSPVNGTNIGPEIHNITVQNFSFNPAEITIKKGDTVAWVNQDSAPHKISGDGFQSGTLNKGQKFSFTFSAVGTFSYICSIHPYMKGKVVVE